MTLYDVTVPLRTGMVTFPGDPPFSMTPCFERKKGDPFDLALLSMGTHIGTHVDPPAHYLDGGATVDRIPLETLVGEAFVLDLRGKRSIGENDLEKGLPPGITRLLLKTDNGSLLFQKEFCKDYVSLSEDGARFLAERRIRLVGIDYLSIERFQNPGAPVHRTLLKAGALIVEGLNLTEVPSGRYEIFCLPLLIKGADGAPARVILRK
jgi:arylformamidase